MISNLYYSCNLRVYTSWDSACLLWVSCSASQRQSLLLFERRQNFVI